jgi:hypothetical protein
MHEWFQRVPKERRRNVKFRRWLLLKCRDDLALRQAVWAACRADPLFYVNAFVWTFDPRLDTKTVPFATFPVQDEAIRVMLACIREGRDLVIEKSRDMGASWISLTVMEYLWHFHPGFTFLMVSRKEDLVDKPGDPGSLFWKVDFIHKHLPTWLMPPGWNPKDHRKRMHFDNPALGGTIDGEATTGAASVGDRRSAIFLDEFSRMEGDVGWQILGGTADATRCRIFNFTPWGTGNAAYSLARRGDMRKLRLHWSDHPEKAAGLYRYDTEAKKLETLDAGFPFPADYPFVLDGKLRSPWYDGECQRRANDREVAQMLDIDYLGSAYQFYDSSVIDALRRQDARAPLWQGDVLCDEAGRFEGLIEKEGGPLRLWMNPTTHGKIPFGKFAAGADIAAGTGATNSCLSVVNCETGEKVAEYATPYARPEQFARTCVALCRAFGDGAGEGCRFIWEQQGPGIVFGLEIIRLGYRNVYYRRNEQSLSKKESDTPGWYPSPDNKRSVHERYRAALAQRKFVNRSAEALAECLAYVVAATGHVEYGGGAAGDDPTGARVNHGDRVVADALAWKLAEEVPQAARTENPDEPPVKSLAWRRKLGREEANDPWKD